MTRGASRIGASDEEEALSAQTLIRVEERTCVCVCGPKFLILIQDSRGKHMARDAQTASVNHVSLVHS
ncbi:hypothetical protein CBOM_07587 [Ceraceosorus bombacis]|uniref:Uncharacterized protein n=1 Tax=Ceraceosorus bombacis TaxID=401625 RepID=A0A0P1BA70_9BASI|nr:hypothetical protein CBOM_07587 [Ceraceosorus bombacis]